MPRFRDDHDRLIALAIERWHTHANEVIDQLAMSVDDPEYAFPPPLPDELTGSHRASDSIGGDTIFIVGALTAEFPNLDPKPIQQVREWIALWNQGQDLSEFPPASRLRVTLNQACDTLSAVMQTVMKRTIADVVKPVKPAGMTWQKAKEIGEAHCQRNPFPGVRALAKIVKCSASTMLKAIDHSPTLRKLLADQLAARKLHPSQMTAAIADSAVQSRHADPLEAASTQEALERLIAAVNPSDREQLKAMPPEKLRELVALTEYDPDAVRERSRRGK